MIKLPENKLQQLESDLNKISFNGIPLGATLVNYLLIVFLIGQSNSGKLTILKEWARSIYINYIGIHFVRKKRRTLPDGLKRGLPLLTFISERSHLFKINYNIWQYGSKDQFNCLLKSNGFSKLFSELPNATYFDELPFDSLSSWRKRFKQIKKPLSKILEKFVQENQLPIVFKYVMMNELTAQTQRIVAFEMLLEQLKPSYILTEYDRNDLCSGLMLVAKKLNIPTFSHMHGVVNHRFGYLPLLADFLFCWGDRQKELLLNKGANPDQLIVSGATQLSNNTIELDRKEILNKLNIAYDQRVAVLATNPINDKDRISLVSIFCQAIDQLPLIKGIVRLHPSEDIMFYQKYIDLHPDIVFDKNEVLNFEESLALADLVCIFNSAYGLDALVKNIPVMIINLNSKGLGQAADLIDNGAFPFANNTEELKTLLQFFFSNKESQHKTIEHQNIYAKSYCSAFGEVAANNILNQIHSKVSSTLITNE